MWRKIVPEERHCQPRAGVHANPLAGNAKPHEQPGQRQIRQELLHRQAHNVALHEAEHEQPAEEDEQHGVGVDGGNARLREVLAVQREHQRGGECKAGFFRQLLAQQVHRRQHQDARQCAHHAPAERHHAENRNAKAHDDLAKRRMARFIRRSAVQVLISRAGVVNLVEIGAVPPARQTFQRILLVENIVCVAVQGGFFHHVQLRNDRRRNAVAVCVLGR